MLILIEASNIRICGPCTEIWLLQKRSYNVVCASIIKLLGSYVDALNKLKATINFLFYVDVNYGAQVRKLMDFALEQ